MKKIISSLLALAMFVSVGVMMVGCDSVNGTYTLAQENTTIITKVEDGKIVETKTLSFDEYTKIDWVWDYVDGDTTWEEALNLELDEEQKAEFDAYLKTRDFYEVKQTLTFKNGKLNIHQTGVEAALNTLLYEREYQAAYEIDGDKLFIKMLSEADVAHDIKGYSEAEYSVNEYEIREDGSIANVRLQYYYQNVPEDYEYTEDDVFTSSNTTYYSREVVYTPVK